MGKVVETLDGRLPILKVIGFGAWGSSLVSRSLDNGFLGPECSISNASNDRLSEIPEDTDLLVIVGDPSEARTHELMMTCGDEGVGRDITTICLLPSESKADFLASYASLLSSSHQVMMAKLSHGVEDPSNSALRLIQALYASLFLRDSMTHMCLADMRGVIHGGRGSTKHAKDHTNVPGCLGVGFAQGYDRARYAFLEAVDQCREAFPDPYGVIVVMRSSSDSYDELQIVQDLLIPLVGGDVEVLFNLLHDESIDGVEIALLAAARVEGA